MVRIQSIVLFIGLLFVPINARGGDDIAMVIVDSGHTVEWLKYHVKVFQEFEVVDEWRKRGSFEFWETPPPFRLANDEGFQSQRAYTYRIPQSGTVIRTGLLTVSGSDTFDKFVSDDLDRRNEKYGSEGQAAAEGSRFKKVIRSPSISYVDEDGTAVTSRTQDLHIAYGDGIMAMGGLKADAFKFPFKDAQRLLRPARGKTWYLAYRPQTVPAQLRGTFLAAVEKSTGVKIQQYDDESSAAYAVRRALGEGYLDVLRSVIMDVEEVSAWTKWPQGKSDPFLARLRMDIQSKSRLSALVSELRSSRPWSYPPRDGDIGYVNINVSLPGQFRSIPQAYISSLFGKDTPVGRTLSETVKKKSLAGSLRLRETDDGHPLVVGAMRLHDTPRNIDQIAGMFRESKVTDDGMVAGQTEWSVFEQDFAAHNFQIAAADKEIRFAMSNGDAGRPPEQSAGLIEKGRTANQPLVEVFLDLKPWLNRGEDTPARMLLQKLETVWLRYGSWSHHKRNMARKRQSQRPGVPFSPKPPVFKKYKSLIGRGNLEGDWTFKATLKATKTAVTIDCRVGRDLHSYWLARRHALWGSD